MRGGAIVHFASGQLEHDRLSQSTDFVILRLITLYVKSHTNSECANK